MLSKPSSDTTCTLKSGQQTMLRCQLLAAGLPLRPLDRRCLLQVERVTPMSLSMTCGLRCRRTTRSKRLDTLRGHGYASSRSQSYIVRWSGRHSGWRTCDGCRPNPACSDFHTLKARAVRGIGLSRLRIFEFCIFREKKYIEIIESLYIEIIGSHNQYCPKSEIRAKYYNHSHPKAERRRRGL